eukprot:90104-Amorphochlora_amoeboformis.AAC.1
MYIRNQSLETGKNEGKKLMKKFKKKPQRMFKHLAVFAEPLAYKYFALCLRHTGMTAEAMK